MNHLLQHQYVIGTDEELHVGRNNHSARIKKEGTERNHIILNHSNACE